MDERLCVICKSKPVWDESTDFCGRGCFLASKRVTYPCPSCDKPTTNLKCFSDRVCPQCESKDKNAVTIDNIHDTRIPCSVCGIEIGIRSNRFEKGRAKFCSKKCFASSRKPSEFHAGVLTFVKAGSQDYDSPRILQRMKELDLDNSVASWSRCQRAVTWVDEQGKEGSYKPDLEIVYHDGSIVIEEIKGRLSDDDVRKTAAAKKFFASLGIVYRTIMDRDENGSVELISESYENDYGLFCRPTLESIFMGLAHQLSMRSTCLRNHVGAVVTDASMTRALCLGFNGSARGFINQCDSLKAGECNCIHAEINAMVKADLSLQNCTLFTTVSPCAVCAKVIVNKGLTRVFYLRRYRSSKGVELLREAGIEVISYADFCDEADEKLMDAFGSG